ncbi:MAG: YezD family protein [Candidatus Omnitrophica bacterium]|nr:YezD family protein [Candidatus Omnitrophota bacterium]
MNAPALVSLLERALKNLRYGHIQLVVHDGQLVRMERVERIRLDKSENLLTGSAGSEKTPSCFADPEQGRTALNSEGKA